MPFIEMKRNQLFDECSFGPTGSLRVPRKLVDKYTTEKCMKIFLDKENNLVGLKPSKEGYKMSFRSEVSHTSIVMHIRPLRKFLSIGRHKVEWSTKHSMFIIKPL